MHILVIEDDPAWITPACHEIRNAHHNVVLCEKYEDACHAVRTYRFDVIVVAQDLFAWITSGLIVCDIQIPVLVLGGNSSMTLFAQAMEAGAGGWLGKPCRPAELLIWITCLGRWKRREVELELSQYDIKLNLLTSKCWIASNPVELTTKEFAFLKAFVQNPGRTLPKSMLWQLVWGQDLPPSNNLIQVYVHRLRALLELLSVSTRIITSRGQGYTLCQPGNGTSRFDQRPLEVLARVEN
jgi:DNA-binding response OmpR family regulator